MFLLNPRQQVIKEIQAGIYASSAGKINSSPGFEACCIWKNQQRSAHWRRLLLSDCWKVNERSRDTLLTRASFHRCIFTLPNCNNSGSRRLVHTLALAPREKLFGSVSRVIQRARVAHAHDGTNSQTCLHAIHRLDQCSWQMFWQWVKKSRDIQVISARNQAHWNRVQSVLPTWQPPLCTYKACHLLIYVPTSCIIPSTMDQCKINGSLSCLLSCEFSNTRKWESYRLFCQTNVVQQVNRLAVHCEEILSLAGVLFRSLCLHWFGLELKAAL